MQRKTIAVLALVALTLGVLGPFYYFQPSQACAPEVEGACKGTVEKRTGENFTVSVSFRNKGGSEGSWDITASFEGNNWTWAGDQQALTLKPLKTRTLEWSGVVPADAPEDSVARLVIYYDNDFTVLDWWIHVVSDAELSIVHSEVT